MPDEYDFHEHCREQLDAGNADEVCADCTEAEIVRRIRLELKHSNPQPLACIICDEKRRSNYDNGILITDDDNTLYCNECKEFAEPDTEGFKLLTCSDCGSPECDGWEKCYVPEEADGKWFCTECREAR